jgi:hypothetical protein
MYFRSLKGKMIFSKADALFSGNIGLESFFYLNESSESRFGVLCLIQILSFDVQF